MTPDNATSTPDAATTPDAPPARAADDAATAEAVDAPERATPLGRFLWALVALGGWAVVVTAARLRPDGRGFGTHEQLGLAPCGFREATGIACPGCGLTTSFAHMAHGHVVDAFSAHLMGPLLFLLTLGLALYAPYAIWRAKPVATFIDSRLGVTSLVVTAAAGVLTFALRVAHVLPVR